MGAQEVEAFLSNLAVQRGVSASPQNQALCGVLYSVQTGAGHGTGLGGWGDPREAPGAGTGGVDQGGSCADAGGDAGTRLADGQLRGCLGTWK